MATKSIISTRTLHVPTDAYVPIKTDPATGGQLEGAYEVEAVAPGTPVALDAKEADRWLARHPQLFMLAPEAAEASRPTKPAPAK